MIIPNISTHTVLWFFTWWKQADGEQNKCWLSGVTGAPSQSELKAVLNQSEIIPFPSALYAQSHICHIGSISVFAGICYTSEKKSIHALWYIRVWYIRVSTGFLKKIRVYQCANASIFKGIFQSQYLHFIFYKGILSLKIDILEVKTLLFPLKCQFLMIKYPYRFKNVSTDSKKYPYKCWQLDTGIPLFFSKIQYLPL